MSASVIMVVFSDDFLCFSFILHLLIQILSQGRAVPFPLFIYLFNYLYQYEFMETYCILWLIIQYYTVDS